MVVSALWERRDAVLALFLAIAYVVEVMVRAPSGVASGPVIDGVPIDVEVARVLAVAFLLSLALRVTAPLVPLGLAFPPLAFGGTMPLDGSITLLVGLALACYSAGAWENERWGLGGFGVAGLAGLAALRGPGLPTTDREVATALLYLGGAWVLGRIARAMRRERGDPRVNGRRADGPGEEGDSLSPEHLEIAREIRDVVERSLSVVVLQARSALRHLDHDPERARHALDVIESTGSDAIADTQRLVGELLAPGTSVPVAASPRLADLDLLAEQVTEAGLPVDVRVEGREVPLSPEVEALAYRVVQEALINALEHAGPARANVVVRYDGDELAIDVVDDGAGVAGGSDAAISDLLAIRGAVSAVGGTLDAAPRDKRGYRVGARIPIEPDW